MSDLARREQIVRLLADHDFELARLEAGVGDVSARRYLRAHAVAGETVVVAVYPQELRDVCRRFVATTRLLTDADIRVPEVVAVSCGDGLMLLEDVGRETMRTTLAAGWDGATAIYRRCIEIIDRIQRLPAGDVAALNPPLDAPRMWRELSESWHELLEPLGLIGTADVRDRFRDALATLCTSLGDEELVPCHRDLMVRNLVWSNGEIVLLDHQDLRLGPPTYDLASLLNDTVYPPPRLEAELLRHGLGSASAPRDYRRAVVQRCLKAAGTFARAIDDGDSRYAKLVAPTLHRAWRHFDSIPELRPLRPALRPDWERYLRLHGLLESPPD